jgi:transcriptional regulator with AAA-type ATPase domain
MHTKAGSWSSSMNLFKPVERRFVASVSQLAYCNPFLPERIQFEREALGNEFEEHHADWNLRPGSEDDSQNLLRLVDRSQQVLDAARSRLADADLNETDVGLYEDLLLFLLYHRWRSGFDQLVDTAQQGRGSSKSLRIYDAMTAQAEEYLRAGERMLPLSRELGHMAACFFQIRRAFYNIFNFIMGVSRPAAELRATVWQSIFTHDIRRFRRTLFNRMADHTTLITGPSGTGKELVAQAVGLSRYVPFHVSTHKFQEDPAGTFIPLNLSALSPTLIESELFGHKRGSFTGATSDRRGWLEVCPALGTVFLDEIGELDPLIQVKLLRVLQTRTFSRLGESDTQRFHGKLIAATNRDLALEMHEGRFRADFYYRLCSDVIAVPTLQQRLADDPAELTHLVAHLSQRIAGDEGGMLAAEVENWVRQRLGEKYPWPGNIRELEQCVRNVLIRRQYHPPQRQAAAGDPISALAAEIHSGSLTADELLSRYCSIVYAQTGSYEATARRVKLDRRTVKAKVDSQAAR